MRLYSLGAFSYCDYSQLVHSFKGSVSDLDSFNPDPDLAFQLNNRDFKTKNRKKFTGEKKLIFWKKIGIFIIPRPP
jgi:hypothetical protein